MLNCRKVNLSTENSAMKVKWNGNFQYMISENFDIPRRVVLFSGSSENTQCSIRHWKFSELQTEIFHRMESARSEETQRDTRGKGFPPDRETLEFLEAAI